MDRMHIISQLWRPFVPVAAALAVVSLAARPALAEDKKDDEPPKITYEDHVKPIFREHCLGCHNQGEAKGGLALDTMSAVMTGGGSGEIVYEGDIEGSRLWQLITHEDTPIMPPGQDKIPAEQIQLVEAWIDGGMLENAGSKRKKKKGNSLAFEGSSGGRPEGPPPMPESVPQAVPVVTERAAAIPAIAASPWAPLVAVAGQRQIVLYHGETAALLGVLPFPEGVPMSLRFSRDGRFLIAAGGEHAAVGIAAIYEVKSGQRIMEVGDEYDVAFDADVNDDMSLVALGGPQKMLRVYSTDDGERVFDIKKHTDWIYAVAFSPDGVLIASGDRSAGLVVWETATGQQYLDLGDHKGAVNDIAWRDDSNVFASASDDGTVKLWDIINGKVIKSINAHNGGVTAVAFDHEGRLVTAGKDRRVKLWDASGNAISEFPRMEEDVLAVAITHDGSRVVGGDWTGTVLLSNAEDPEQQLALAANPPSAKQRLKAQLEKLEAFQPEFASSAAKADELGKQLAAAKDKQKQLVTQREKKVDQAKKVEEEAAKVAKQADQLREKIAKQSRASRDLHDLVVAARLGDLSSDKAQVAVAKREAELAESLQQVANMRRQQIEQRSAAKSKRDEAAELMAEAAKMDEPIKSAEAAVAEVQQAVDQYAETHAKAVAQKESLDQAIAQLEEAVEIESAGGG